VKHDWIEIRAKGPSGKKDEAALFLVEAGCPGILEEEAPSTLGKLIPHSLGHEVCEGTPSPVASCRAYLDAKYSPKLDKLKKDLLKIGWKFTTSPYKEVDWSLKWKRGLRPIRVSYGGSQIIVKPTWKAVKAEKGDVVV
jgi:ribosomal protein L11 methylase PrmA